MTYPQLRELYESHAFNPRPMQDWFAATHVPFDALLGTDTVETRVQDAAVAGGIVSVMGTSGTGKTSLLGHALQAPRLLPIWMHVASEKPDLVTEPLGFGQLVISAIVDAANMLLSSVDVDRSLAMAGERYQRDGLRHHKHRGVGLTPPWGNLDLAREVTTAAPSISRPVTVADITREVSRLLQVIHGNGAMPVIVVDDSDRFRQVVSPASGDAPDLFSPFATQVLPWLADLDCARVVAVHPGFARLPAWSTARRDGLAGSEVAVPRLTDPGQFGAILSQRLSAFDVQAALSDVVAPSAVERLFDFYAARPHVTIRVLLTLANAAVVLACDQRAQSVSELHVESAEADLG